MQAHLTASRLELTFGPTMSLIRLVRQFICDFYNKMLDRETTQMVAIATHELLENALKYSEERRATLNIEVLPNESGQRVVIQIRNRSGEEHIRPLQALLERMNRAPDAMEHYVTLMRETSKRKEGSGLGLARLRAEAGMDLDLELEGTQVCITAQCNVERRADS
jgi:two-component sensor histidine kinase